MNFSSKARHSLLAMIPILAFVSDALAHKGMHHGQQELSPAAEVTARHIEQEINTDFQSSVQPIFDSKCVACHGKPNDLPWYSSLPIAKGIIQRDLEEAKEHLDMSAGFPFGGHGSDYEDLEAIRDSVSSGDMPPFRYRLLHWNSALSREEKDAVFSWVTRAQATLKGTTKGNPG